MTRILIADDHSSVRELMALLLGSYFPNAEFETASNGHDVVQKTITWKPDIILMDIRMPTLNGFEATKRIRELDNKRASVPIFAVTAFGDAATRDKAQAAGADRFFVKPVNHQQLAVAMISHMHDIKYPGAHERKLIEHHTRRLKVLREQKAYHGLNVPPEIEMEIEDIEAKLMELREGLNG